MKARRVPMALRLFLTVLLTTLVITTVSLGVLHGLCKKLSSYVANVEMQLDRLIENLAGVYGIYNDWGNAIQAQILQIEGQQRLMIMTSSHIGGCAVSMILHYSNAILKNIL